MMNMMWIKQSNKMMIDFNGLVACIFGCILRNGFNAISASIFGKRRYHLFTCGNRLNCWGAFV